MTEQRKYAILDTDFVSKANIIKTENRMLANVPIEFVLNDIYGGMYRARRDGDLQQVIAD